MRSRGIFVAYYRVSTEKQGRSGLGLDAQKEAVREYLMEGGRLVGEHLEVESGRRVDRPELCKALVSCRLHHATLLVAKLDRLSRNAHILLGLKESGCEFVACDLPNANHLTVGILAMVAEEEARVISLRTRAALAATKARGTKLGNDNLTAEGRVRGNATSIVARRRRLAQRKEDLLPLIAVMQAEGHASLAKLAIALNCRGVPAPRGGAWVATQVRRILRPNYPMSPDRAIVLPNQNA
jgi:hypothetical protein